jgi:Ca2+-binding EF-hand superfamily protein
MLFQGEDVPVSKSQLQSRPASSSTLKSGKIGARRIIELIVETLAGQDMEPNKVFLTEAFEEMDKNGDGVVTRTEVADLFDLFGTPVGREEIEELFEDFSSDSSRKYLTRADFFFMFEESYNRESKDSRR